MSWGPPHPPVVEVCAAFGGLERAYIAADGEWLAGSPDELASDVERQAVLGCQAKRETNPLPRGIAQ